LTVWGNNLSRFDCIIERFCLRTAVSAIVKVENFHDVSWSRWFLVTAYKQTKLAGASFSQTLLSVRAVLVCARGVELIAPGTAATDTRNPLRAENAPHRLTAIPMQRQQRATENG
jgi:hypothetical protein